jgi:hypothetical protein
LDDFGAAWDAFLATELISPFGLFTSTDRLTVGLFASGDNAPGWKKGGYAMTYFCAPGVSYFASSLSRIAMALRDIGNVYPHAGLLSSRPELRWEEI